MLRSMFNIGHAEPLDVTRILCPRIGRGGHAERPRGINVPWPEPWHVHKLSLVGNGPPTRFVRVRELSMSALSPRPQARSQTVRIRDRIAISTVRDQALAADTNCPQTVRSLDLSTSANSSRSRIRRDPRLARNCPRRRILDSISSPAHFPVRVRIIPIFPSPAVNKALSAPASRAAGRPCPPLDRARSATLPARSSRAAISHWPKQRRLPSASRRRALRSGWDSLCAPLPLCSTFPARRPQTEADSLIFSPPDHEPRLGVLAPPAPD